MLEKFGFTPTENRVYTELLRIGPATGYVVARELSMARANVYQALESLHRRSAASKTATSPVLYSAAGPAALLAELERGFRRDLTALEEGLRSLPLAAGRAGQLEQLTSTDQLLARAASCVDAARAEILGVLGPWASPLYPRLAAAGARKVAVRVVALGEPAPEGFAARVVSEAALREYWGGLPLLIVADSDRAACGVIGAGSPAGGLATTMPGVLPFFRHLIRREIAGGALAAQS